MNQERVEPPTDQNSADVRTLVSSLTKDASRWVRQETALVKAEISEKLSDVRRNATLLIAGAFTIYAGVILLLMAAAGGIALFLASQGLTPVQSLLIGLAGVGVLTTTTGLILCRNSKENLSVDELKPERTVETLKESKEWAESKVHQ